MSVVIVAICALPATLFFVNLGFMLAGAREPWTAALLRLVGVKWAHSKVTGFVAPGYEQVRHLFQQIIESGMEENAQVAAYVDGELVVDLAGVHDCRGSTAAKYTTTSIQNVFSSTKAVSSIVMAMLVDRGYFTYATPISKIWPEFAAKDKKDITIEDLLKHESGLQKFDFSLKAADLQRSALKSTNIVGSLIANASSSRGDDPMKWRAYHAVTRGWIENEILMRVDPKKRTMGEFIRDEIAVPLGLADEYTLGTETVLHAEKICPLVANNMYWVVCQIFNPINRKVPLISLLMHLFFLSTEWAYKVMAYLQGPKFAQPSLIIGKPYPDYVFVGDLFNHPLVRSAEVPSANSHASARALAKIASVMAMGGACHGVQFLKPTTYALAHGNVTSKYDKVVYAKTKFTSGGWSVFDTKFAYNRQGSIGWFGLGGSAIQWHRELKVGFGYACNLVGADLGNYNSSLLQNEILNCARNLKSARRMSE